MNLIKINEQIKNILSGLDYATLPNYPNISGFIAQSSITFIVGSGKFSENDYIDLELRVSIATEKRTSDYEDPTKQDLSQPLILDEVNAIEQNLDNLIGIVISKFHKRPLKGSKPIQFKQFEISPPQSGKWRALLLFSIPVRIVSNFENEIEPSDPLTEIIDRRYAL